MMYKRRTLQASIALGLVLTLACGLIPSSFENPTLPTPQFADVLPADVPTPVSTTIPSTFEATYIGTELTGLDGKAIVRSSNLTVDLNVEVKDKLSNKPLEGIQIQAIFVESDTKVLIVALDPNKEYFTSIVLVDNPKSQKDNTVSKLGVSFVRAQSELALALFMVKMVEWWDTGKSALEFFSSMPEISNYSFWYSDYCFTGNQLASYFGFTSGVATSLIPIPNAGTELENQLLEAIFAISAHNVSQDFDDYLRSLSGGYLIRIHRFPSPNFSNLSLLALSLVGLEYLGSCSAAIDEETTLRQIGFLVDGNIWMVRADGSNKEQLTNSGKVNNFSWSPDGNQLFFTKFDTNDSMYVYDLGARQERQVVASGINSSTKFDISPDGKTILFLTQNEGMLSYILSSLNLETGIITKITSLEGYFAGIQFLNSSEVVLANCTQACEISTLNLIDLQSVEFTELVFGASFSSYSDKRSIAIEASAGFLGFVPCDDNDPACSLPSGIYEFDLNTRSYSSLVLDEDVGEAVTEPDISSDNLYLVFQIGNLDNFYLAIKNLRTGEVNTLVSGRSPSWRPPISLTIRRDQ